MKLKYKFPTYKKLDEKASKVETKKVARIQYERHIDRETKDVSLLQTLLEGAFKGLPS